MKKLRERKNSAASVEKKINDLQRSLNEMMRDEKKFMTRILIKGKEGYSLLSVHDILWMEANSDYVKLHSKDKAYLKTITMNELEARLDPQQFIRIHRSTIVNVSFIKELKPYFNGEYFIYLTNGDKLKLSRNYKNKIKLIAGDNM